MVSLEMTITNNGTMVLGGGANQTIIVQKSMPWDTGKAKAKEKAMVDTAVVMVRAMAREATKAKAIAKEVTKEVAKAKAKEKIRAAEVSISRETPLVSQSLSVIATTVDYEVIPAGTAQMQAVNMRIMGPVANAEFTGIR